MAAAEQVKDLYSFEAILATTTINGNDDVLLAQDTWSARHTPVNKPINLEHKQDKIVGHMTGSQIMVNGEIYSGEESPAHFDITSKNVLYSVWDNEAKQKEIDKLIQEIEEGKWGVSMECLYKHFDYLVFDLDKPQEARLVERTDATKFLTKYLKHYGGPGLYKDKRVVKAPRNFVFSGQGLTKKPANPTSVILSAGAVMAKVEPGEEMVAKAEYENLMGKMKAMKAEHEELMNKHKEVSGENARMKAEYDDMASKCAAEKCRADEMAMKHENLSKEHDAAKAALADMAIKNKMEARASILVASLGLDKEKATAKAKLLASLEDDAFEKLVAEETEYMTKKIEEYKKASSGTPAADYKAPVGSPLELADKVSKASKAVASATVIPGATGVVISTVEAPNVFEKIASYIGEINPRVV